MKSGVDDAMVLADQFFAGELRDVAELVVNVSYPTGLISYCDDGRFVERSCQVLELFDRVTSGDSGVCSDVIKTVRLLFLPKSFVPGLS